MPSFRSSPCLSTILVALNLSIADTALSEETPEKEEQLDHWEQQLKTKKTTLKLSASSDDSALKDKTVATVGLDWSAGTYPSQLRVETKWNLEFEDSHVEDDTVKDELSSFVFNYDHYSETFADWMNTSSVIASKVDKGTEPKCQETESSDDPRYQPNPVKGRTDIETFVFGERFSDSYLALSSRYELGFGSELEWNIGKLTGKGRRNLASLRKACANAPGDTEDGKLTLDHLRTLSRAEAHNHQANAWLQLGLAVSLLHEFEQPAAIDATYVDPDDATKKEEFRKIPAASNTNRFSIRPGIRLRLTDHFELTARYYYKRAIGSDTRLPSGKRDVRTLTYVKISFKPGKDEDGLGSTSIDIVGEWHHDEGPPDLSEYLEDVPLASRATLFPVSAPRHHRNIRLEVAISL